MRKFLKILLWTLNVLVILFLGLSAKFNSDFLLTMKIRLDETEDRAHKNAEKALASEKISFELTCQLEQVKSELEACKAGK